MKTSLRKGQCLCGICVLALNESPLRSSIVPPGFARRHYAFGKYCKVSAWQLCHDRALRRLFQYIAYHADLELVGCLDARDKESCVLVMSPDADLAGDLETAKSTSGLWIEMRSADGKRCWPIAWRSKR